MTAQYRVAVAGCGGMANAWIEYALSRSDTQIVALVDIRLESAQAMAAKHEISCLTFTDIKEAIQTTEANLVFDVTVPGSHYSISSTALELGCNVFSEKPLAETMEECTKIVEISERTGNAHAVMQNRRYDPRIRSLRNLIESDTIGRVGYISSSFFLGAHFGGSVMSWKALYCWIWRSIPLIRPDLLVEPIRFPFTVRSLILPDHGIRGMRRQCVYLRCRTDLYLLIRGLGVQKVPLPLGKQLGV